MARDRGIDPHHHNQVERKLEDHPRNGSADDGAVQRDFPAPTPREVENHEKRYQCIDNREYVNAHARLDEARIGFFQSQLIDRPGNAKGAQRQRPYRDQQPRDGGPWSHDHKRHMQPFSRIDKPASHNEQYNREEGRLASSVGNPLGEYGGGMVPWACASCRSASGWANRDIYGITVLRPDRATPRGWLARPIVLRFRNLTYPRMP